MRIVNYVAAAALAASIAAPALAENPAAAAVSQQVQLLLKHAPALQADVLRVDIEGQTVYVRGVVDSQLEYTQLDSLITAVPEVHIVNATVVIDGGS